MKQSKEEVREKIAEKWLRKFWKGTEDDFDAMEGAMQEYAEAYATSVLSRGEFALDNVGNGNAKTHAYWNREKGQIESLPSTEPVTGWEEAFRKWYESVLTWREHDEHIPTVKIVEWLKANVLHSHVLPSAQQNNKEKES